MEVINTRRTDPESSYMAGYEIEATGKAVAQVPHDWTIIGYLGISK